METGGLMVQRLGLRGLDAKLYMCRSPGSNTSEDPDRPGRMFRELGLRV